MYNYIYTRMSVRNFVYSKDLEGSCGQYSVANCRCDVSAFDLRRPTHRPSIIDLRRSTHRSPKVDTSIFEGQHIDLRRSTHRDIDRRSSKGDTSIFESRHIDLRKSPHRFSKIDGRCEIRLLYLLKTLILYISCM